MSHDLKTLCKPLTTLLGGIVMAPLAPVIGMMWLAVWLSHDGAGQADGREAAKPRRPRSALLLPRLCETRGMA